MVDSQQAVVREEEEDKDSLDTVQDSAWFFQIGELMQRRHMILHNNPARLSEQGYAGCRSLQHNGSGGTLDV